MNLEEYKKNHPVICSQSSETYSNQNIQNTAEFRKNIRERGPGSEEYLKKMGQAVRKSILSNPEELKRRAGIMTDVNKSDVMRKKSSETAIKTSARKDIQENRSAQLKKWRDENPDKFYDRCISKMLSSWSSEPEKLLYDLVKDHKNYHLKRHRKVRSPKFIGYKQRDIDIGDANFGLYIEYDGPLHFKETSLNQLEEVKLKDKLFDEYIIENKLILIRIGCDQFSYRKSDYGFKKECLERVFEILDNPTPGVHRIGEVYIND